MRLVSRTTSQRSSPIGAHAHLLDQVPSDRPLLDLSQGAPGFPPAPEVVRRMRAIAADPSGSRYAPLLGLPHLREAFASELSDSYRGSVHVEDVCITAGCNQAFAMAASTICEPGDEVILPVPFYFNHDMWLGLDSLVPKYLRPADGLNPTIAEAEALLTPRTRAIVLVTPGNPTGHILSPKTLADFADFAQAHDIALIIDETYRSFVPGGEPPHALFAKSEWREHVISLHSFSKDLAIPGQRVGAVVGSPSLLVEVAKLIDCVTICAPRIGQEAAHAGLTEAGEWRARKIAEIASKQTRFSEVMMSRPGGFELRSAGAYYGWVQHPHASKSSDDVVEQLLVEQGVLTIPGTAFAPEDQSMIRFSFANADIDRLDELTTRLAAIGIG